jgi:CelD/BcsL family acetyltransferase involved in cellulose biosynthesis
MHVSLIGDLSEFEGLRSDWDRLAGDQVFRSWAWHYSWWEAFRPCGRLFLGVCRNDEGEVVAIAPWYISRRPAQGRIVRFLGTGKACGEYLGMVCRGEDVPQVAAAIADWLIDQRWDAIELEAVAPDDPGVNCLLNELKQRQAKVVAGPGMPCWRIDLPGSWEEYLSRMGHSYKRKTRNGFRKLVDSGRATWHLISEPPEIATTLNEFKDMHTRRRAALDGDHCFQTEGFESFLSSVTSRILDSNRLYLTKLKIDGRAAAICIGFCSRPIDETTQPGNVHHVYQGTMEPNLAELAPGWLLNALNIRQCIDRGFSRFDFLRGDEAYKAQLTASPVPMVQYRVTAPRALSRLRSRVWSTGQSIKSIGRTLVKS